MRPLIDGDILLYEIGACGEYVDENGQHEIRHFDFVRELADNLIARICRAVEATETPVLFFTDDNKNFRYEIAKRKGYKMGRDKSNRPFHYQNLKAYLRHSDDYIWVLSDGGEADDEMAIWQVSALARGEPTVICTRDKDLRMVPGWHYGWECGRQPEYYKRFIPDSPEVGRLTPVYYKEGPSEGKLQKVEGEGLKWFYFQLLCGDPVDTIPGLKGVGPVKALKALGEAQTEEELFSIVRGLYENKYEADWEEELMEQAALVWMVREREEDGTLKMWRPPYG